MMFPHKDKNTIYLNIHCSVNYFIYLFIADKLISLGLVDPAVSCSFLLL